MGRLSTCCALVALLCVAGSFAARPVDISNLNEAAADAIQPLHLLEEKVIVDTNRELLSMNYPPPPPVEETQEDEERTPRLIQTLELEFANSTVASDWVTAVDGPHSMFKGLAYNDTGLNQPQLFVKEYMQSALGGAETAESGKVSVSRDGSTVTITLVIFYPNADLSQFTESRRESEANSIKSSIFSDTTVPNPGQSRKLLGMNSNLYEDAVTSSGGTTTYSEYQAAVTASTFALGDIDGAQGLRASLLMGLAVVLSAFLLA